MHLRFDRGHKAEVTGACAKIARWQRCNADDFKKVYDNYMLLIPIYTYMMTK